MRDLVNDHKFWISNYSNSKLFRCEDIRNCEASHVLTPILSDIGLLTTYKSYSSIIYRFVMGIFSRYSEPNIIVMGVESESSARSLINVLNSFQKKYTVTFIDCCETPLNRIRECLEGLEPQFIKTSLVDVLSTEFKSNFGMFDAVFSDSFIKQFVFTQKKEILDIFCNLLRDKNSVIIIREHFGDISKLVSLLWKKLEFLSNNDATNILKEIIENTDFIKMVKRLDKYYKLNGQLYKNETQFEVDVKFTGLDLIDKFANKNGSDKFFLLTKSITT